MTQQPIVGDQCFLLSEFRDALVKICSSKVCVFIWKINNHNTFWRQFGSLTAKIGFRHGHFFRKKISSSVFIIENEPVLVAIEPHFGQHAGALGSKPPAIAINSCPQQGHFAFENPVSIVSSLFSCTTSDATRIIHTILHQLAAGEHGHCSDEQFGRKFQNVIHKP